MIAFPPGDRHAGVNAAFASLPRWRESFPIQGFQLLPQLAHLTDFRRGQRNRVHAHRAWEWSYIRSGRLSYLLEGGPVVRAQAGDLIALPPGRRHSWKAEAETTAFGLMVFVTHHGEGARGAVKDLAARASALRFRVPDFEAMGSLTEQLLEEVSSGRPARDEAISALLRLAAVHIMRRLMPAGAGSKALPQLRPRRGAAGETLVELVRFFIHDQYGRSLGLSELGSQFGYSPDHLNLLYKRKTGESIPAYLAAYRLERSKELLCETDRSIGEIAAAVGFSDAAYFARSFRRACGETPTAFRRRAS
ncbi:MAG: helix-turn-helix transcriptional regulator [Spirochaetes bacterium]|nr:helix-turn-helix transcriptional regulator [Spirochaetota bacterium]